MAEIRTEQLYALVSVVTSGLDTRPLGTVQPAISAYLGTMYDMMFKLNNRITTQSAAITTSGGGASSVIVVQSPTALSGIAGIVHGWPFWLSFTGLLSGAPTSLMSTTSTTIRKVLVGLLINIPADEATSTIAITSATMGFVYGSLFATSALACTSGGQSAFYNSVPLPLASAGMVPLGWLNVPNSAGSNFAFAGSMVIVNWRAIQGFDLSALGTRAQP